MIRRHKIRLYPNDAQATYFSKACGVARFAYNWALSEWKRKYDAGETVKEPDLRKALNAIKREQFPWMRDVARCVPQLAIKKDLNNALRDFKKKGTEPPQYRRKGAHDSFMLANDHFAISGRKVWIQKLGWVKIAEEFRFDGKITDAIISRRADKWHITVQTEMAEMAEMPEMPDAGFGHVYRDNALGISFGDGSSIVLSDGTASGKTESGGQFERKIRRLHQGLSRRQGARKGESQSANYKSTKGEISRLYAKIDDIQADETHKLTTRLTRQYGLIGIEDPGAKGFAHSQNPTRGAADKCLSVFRRQLEYKAAATGTRIIAAESRFPARTLCSICGHTNEGLAPNDREWTCAACGVRHDSDLNAAINLRNYAIKADRELKTP